ncbi:MAG: HYR domain-containing protein [Saprospiraceae bacterium]|nr:HYR domain-containing protein [Saprospiraceae bacterium]
MTNLCTLSNKLRSSIPGWFICFLMIVGLFQVSYGQVPACNPITGNTLTGPAPPPNITVNFDAGCSITVPNLLPRWVATPGPGFVLVAVVQAPLAGTVVTVPKSGACANEDIAVLIEAFFFFLGNPLDPTDDVFCSLSRIDNLLIRDNTPPSILPKMITLDVGPGCVVTPAQILATYTAADVDDNCTSDAALLSGLVFLGPLPAPLACPVNPVTAPPAIVRITDACGNTNLGIVIITLRDLTIPTITCPGPFFRNFDDFCEYTIEDFRAGATITDGCGGQVPPTGISQRVIAPVVLNLDDFTEIITGGGCPSARVLTIRLCAQDCFGNGPLDPPTGGPIPSNCCTFNVTITDNTPPVPDVSACPAPVILTTDANCMVTIPDFRDPALFVDNCDPIFDVDDIIQSPAPGPLDASTFVCPPGQSPITVTFRYTDCNGNGPVTTVCPMVITIIDDMAPDALTCPVPMDTFNLAIDLTTCQYTFATVPLDWFNGRAVATDNCDPNPREFNAIENFDCYELGIQPIDIGAVDCSGNENPFVGSCNVFIRANPQDADWLNPGIVCLNTGQLPLNLCALICCVPCGEWSGDAVTPGRCSAGGGIFNPTLPGAYAVTYTVGDANCHVEVTRVINVEQTFAAPFLIDDFGVCLCPDAIIDLETFLLGSAPEGGTWTISNSGGLQFVLLPPPGPGNSHAARYDGGCGVSTITYTYTNCSGATVTDVINVTIRRCKEIIWDFNQQYCQDEPFSLRAFRIEGCVDDVVNLFVAVGPDGNALIGGAPISLPLGSFVFPVLNTQVSAGDYGLQLDVVDPTGICPTKSDGKVITIYQAAGEQSTTAPNGITNPGILCETDTWPLVLTLLNPNDIAGDPFTAANVRWFGGGVTDNGTTGTFTPNDSDGDGFPGPGTYTVCVNVGDQRCEQTYCILIQIENHVVGTCALIDYRACLDPGATISFSDLLSSTAITGGTFTIISAPGAQTFNYTGAAQTYVVPAGVTSVNIETWGAQGGAGGTSNNPAGLGGYASGTLAVVPGQVLNIYVGGQGTSFNGADANNAGGFNGGGNGGFDNFPQVENGGGGGGASDIRVGGTALADRVIVAAGGGGGSGGFFGPVAPGADGGGLIGNNAPPHINSIGGTGGTQAAGGVAGTLLRGATDGTLGQGGNGSSNVAAWGSGGAGGGYFGGGGGTSTTDHGSGFGAGGGGGSSYIGGVTAATTTTGVQTGPGLVRITAPTVFSVIPGDVVTGLVYNGGCGTVEYQYTIPSCPDDIVCRGTIVVNQLPHISLSGPQIYCANDVGPYTIRNNGTTTLCGINGVFSGPGITDAGNGATASFNPQTAGEGTHNIIYTIGTNTPGGPDCQQIDTLEVVINAASDPSFVIPINVCADVTAVPLVLSNPHASVNAGSPDGNAEVIWSGPGVTDNGGNDPTGSFDPSVAGPGYHLICVMTGESNCMKYSCRLIRVYPVNNATLRNDVARGCFIFNNSNGGPFVDFNLEELKTAGTTPGGTWSHISGPAFAIRNYTMSASPGCHQLRYTVPAAFPGAPGACAEVSDDVFLLLLEAPTPSFDLAEEVCWNGIPGSLTLSTLYNGNTSGVNSTRTYVWTATAVSGGPIPTFNDNTVQSPTITAQGAGVFEICVTEILTYAACGSLAAGISCPETYCERITIHQTNTEVNPTWTRPNPFRFCTTDPCIDLDLLVTGTPNGVFTGQGVQLDPSHPNYRFCPAVAGVGTHAITYTVQNGAGCTAVMTHNLEVYGPVTAACPEDDFAIACATRRLGSPQTYGGFPNASEFFIPVNIESYYTMGTFDLLTFLCPAATRGGTWSIVSSPTNALGGGITGVVQSNTLVYTDPGCYIVRYTVMAFPGATGACTATFDYRLTVGEEPTPGFNLPDQICWAVGVPTISYNIVANYLTSQAPHPNTTLFLRAFNSSNNSVATVSAGGVVTIIGAGIVTICMQEHYDNANCSFVECRKEYCETITITNSVTASNPNWTGFGPICVDAPCVRLDLLVTGTPGGVFTGAGVSTTTAGHPQYEFCPAVAGVGTHAVTYTVNSPDGCSNVLTRNIVVAPLANATLANKQIPCIVEPGGVIPLSVLFASTATSPGGSWSFAGTPPSGAQIMGNNLVFTQAGCYCFTYTVTTVPGATGGGCFAQSSACLQISEQPTPSFSVQNEICWSTNDPVTTFNPLVNSPSYDAAGVVTRTWGTSPTPLPQITLNTATGAFTINGPVPLGGLIFDLCMTETITTPICGPAAGPNPASPANPASVCTEQYCERISIRDGTLLNATFTANPVNPCIGQSVTLTPAVAGGTFTGNGVTFNGNGGNGTFVPTACGIYAVTYTLDDPNGCSNSYTLNIYTDTVRPTLTLPANIIVDCQNPLSPSMAAWAAGASATDNCAGVVVTNRVFDRQSACSPGTGTYVFVFTATDACGNTRVGYANYTVRDITPPVITGGSNLIVECGNDVYARVYAWLDSHAGTIGTDACDASPFLLWTNNFSGLINNYCGVAIPVVFTVSDRCGNVASVTFTLQVRDQTPPVWNVRPQNTTLECDGTNDPYQQVSAWLRANGNGVALDSCQITINYTNNFNGLTGGCNRNTGSALVTFTAADVCGNTTTAQATVTVVDKTAPEILSPARDTVVECDGNGNAAGFAAWINNHASAVAADLCSGVTCQPFPGAKAALVSSNPFPWGGGPSYDDYTTSMNQIFGVGNWDRFDFTVSAATLFSRNYRFIYIDGSDAISNTFNTFINNNLGLAEAWVTCGGRLLLNAAPNTGGNINLGFGGVQITYPNFTPNVIQANPHPIFNGPYLPTGAAYTGNFFGHAIIGPPSMNIIIRENGGANRPVLAESLWGGGIVMFGGMTASGFHGPQPNARNLKWNILDYLNTRPLQLDQDVLSGGIFIWDTTFISNEVTCGQNRRITYRFNALDSCGNISNGTVARFIVRDTTPPVWIVNPGNLQVQCDGRGNITQLNNWLTSTGGGSVLTDLCNGVVRFEHDQVREYDRCSNTDSTIYRFTAYDCSGNSSTREASFIIIDNLAPTIVSPARDTTISCENLSGNNDDELIGWLNYRAGFNTVDACSDQITYTNDYQAANWVRVCGPARFVIVTFSATDDCGNVSRSSARFTITDNIRPRFLNCPPPIVQDAEKDHCDAYVTVPKLVATDNCTQADSIVITQIFGPNPVQFRFPVGTTILKYEARDLCNNRDTCTIKVVVNDYWDIPVITCPANLDLVNDPGVCGKNNVTGLAPVSVRDICPHTAVTYVIRNEAGDTIKKGIRDASNSNFPKGNNQICYTVQDQPILLITEVTQQIDAIVVGTTSPLPFFISPADVNGDYVEITNFGPSSIDVSCLSLNIFQGGVLVGTYTLPNMPGPVLPSGGVLTLHVGAALPGFPDNPAAFFYNMNLPEVAINMPRGYVLNHLSLRNVDAVTTNGYSLLGQGTPAMTAAGWSGISPTNLDRGSYYRYCILDRNIADDWRLAEGCEPASIGRVNPILAQYVFPSNGLITSVQTIAAQKDTCCFNVLVRDTEIPMCATNDTFTFTGLTGTASGPGCYTFNLTVPVNPTTKIIDIWVTNLNLTASNFANTEGTLIHPDGTRVRLWNDGVCNGFTNFIAGRISDLDPTKVANAICASLAGGLNYKPDQPLSVLCPKSAAGTWRLEIENNSASPSSISLNGWSLRVLSQRAYAQRDTTFNNDLDFCGANFMWIHPVVMDNCCMGTVDVTYIPVPMPGCPLHSVPTGGRVNPGTKTTQFFSVGATRVVYTLTDMSGNTGSCEFTVTIRDAQAPVFTNCPKDYTINLNGGDCYAFLEINPALWADDNCDSVRITVNPPLNTQLGIGVHKITATATDKAGNSTMCMWNITVVENNPTSRDLACVDEINFSLGPDCLGTITADELLAGINYGCKDRFTLIIEDWITGARHSNVFTTADIGRYFKVTVIDPVTGNKCWSKVFIEYKATPAIDCPRDTIVACNSSLDPEYLGNPIIRSCVFDYDIHYDDTITKARDCDFPIAFIIKRTFTVTNELGNGSQCTQIIQVKAFDLSKIEWPRSYDNLDLPALHCDAKRFEKDVTPHILPSPYCVDGYLLDSAYWYLTGGDPRIVDPFTRDLSGDRLPKLLGWNYLEGGINDGHPSPYGIYYDAHPQWRNTGACWGPNQVWMWQGTGAPSLDGVALNKDNKNCNLSIRYDDEVYDVCANGYEILRYWKVRNMCLPPLAGVNPVEYIQVIKVLDEEGPKIAYPDTVIVGTNPWTCDGTWEVPAPWITDNCSDSINFTVRTWSGTAIQQLDGSWIVINMKLGVHPVVITAIDACGNKTEKTIKVNVIDNTPPTAVCDRNIVVSIAGNQSPGENFGKIFAEDINDGSFDNCRAHVFFKAIRMEHLRNTNNGSNANQPDNGTNCASVNGDDNVIIDGNQIYFDDYVKFCCTDAGKRIMVVMRVFDVEPGDGPVAPSRMNQNGSLFGHYSDCMVEIEIQDKGVPTVVPPPNIVVSCWFWFDVDKLTDPNDPTFGRVVTDLSDRHKVVTTDLVCYNYCVRNDITGYPGFVPGAPPSNPPAWNRACDYYRSLFDTAHYDRKYELVWGFDGYVLSNCGNTPTISVNDNRECGQGQITRTVVARGPNGISVTGTQIIWVVDCDPFYINRADNCDPDDDITWPGNCTGQATTINGCGADISPDNPLLGRPVIENGADDLCALISIEYFDEIFTIEPDACFKVLRKWVVIDWCQYDPSIDPVKGRWEYLQIIKVHDTDKPVVSIEVGPCEPAVKRASDNICYGHISLVADATDNCSPLDWLFYDYKIDLFNDGIGTHQGYDFKVGPLTRKEYAAGRTPLFHHNPLADNENNPFEASGTYPIGIHKICWFVEDGCGNIGTLCQLFEVKDCKAPTPYCLTGVITVPMPASKCVTVWAKDLDRGSFDNCTTNDALNFYFDGDTSKTSITICCDDFVAAGANDELLVEVQMWVEDEEGNTDYCKTVIIVQDNQDLCPNSSNVTGKITGNLKTEKGDETEFADVQMHVGPKMMKQVTTHADGHYMFGDLAVGASAEYAVKPARNDNHINGVSTADIVKIQRHILGIELLNSPYKLIAADVNATNAITAADVSEIRKLILGITSEFAKVQSWTFVPTNYVFPLPIAPWNAPRQVLVPMPNTGTHVEDFVAIKMGDVTNNAAAHNFTNATSRHKDQLHFEIESGKLKAGEVYEINFMASNFEDIAGYQYTFKFDQEAMLYEGIKGGVLDIDESNFGVTSIDNGILTTSWNSNKGMSFKSDEVLFTLSFRALKDANVSDLIAITSDLTTAEAYNASLDIKGVDLGVRTDNGVVESGVFELYQNTPNPFETETVVSFRLPTASPALLTIYDVTGKVVRVYEINGVKGLNSITIGKDDIETSGVLYYQLDGADHTATKRMTKLK